jgi:hypothetical protein
VANRPDPRKEHFWRRKLDLWKRSGLSVRAFCQQHNLSEPSFYSWRTVIAQRDAQGANRPAAPAERPADQAEPLFLPLRLATSAEPLEVVLPDGTLVRVPATFDAGALARLLAVLRGASC